MPDLGVCQLSCIRHFALKAQEGLTRGVPGKRKGTRRAVLGEAIGLASITISFRSWPIFHRVLVQEDLSALAWLDQGIQKTIFTWRF